MSTKMVTLSTAMKSAKNLLIGNDAFVFLFEMDQDGTTTSYYAQAFEDVTFDGQAYVAKPIKFEPPSEDVTGTLHDFVVSIDDALQIEMAHLRNGRYRNRPLAIKLVNIDPTLLASAANQRLWRGEIKSAAAKEKGVTFTCGGKDLRKAAVPRATINTVRCRHFFKGGELLPRCGYSAAQISCDLRPETCLLYNNLDRFGGAMNMPVFRA